MTEVAVQYGQEYIESLTYEQKVEKLDELLTRLDNSEGKGGQVNNTRNRSRFTVGRFTVEKTVV